MDKGGVLAVASDWTMQMMRMAACCTTRKEPPNEYDQLRKALQKKQEEVRRLQDQVDALEKAPSPMPAVPSRRGLDASEVD